MKQPRQIKCRKGSSKRKKAERVPKLEECAHELGLWVRDDEREMMRKLEERLHGLGARMRKGEKLSSRVLCSLPRLEISELNHQASDEFQSAIYQPPLLTLPPPLPAQAPDEFQRAMNDLKEYNGNSEYFDLLEILEKEYKAKAYHVEDCPKKPPPCLEQGRDKFEEAMTRLKGLLAGSVCRYALAVCEEEYKAKAGEMEDSSVVSPSAACGDCGKMLGSGQDLKKMETAVAPTPDCRNDVQIFMRALNALKASEDAPKMATSLTPDCGNDVEKFKVALKSSVDEPSTACEDCCEMLGSLHDLKKMATALTPDSCIMVDILVKACNAIVEGIHHDSSSSFEDPNVDCL